MEQLVDQLRQEGNESYKHHKFHDAIEAYTKALGALLSTHCSNCTKIYNSYLALTIGAIYPCFWLPLGQN